MFNFCVGINGSGFPGFSKYGAQGDVAFHSETINSEHNNRTTLGFFFHGLEIILSVENLPIDLQNPRTRFQRNGGNDLQIVDRGDRKPFGEDTSTRRSGLIRHFLHADPIQRRYLY